MDVAPSLLSAARAAHRDGAYALADAESLPYRDDSFDVVVAYNLLMNVADLPGTATGSR